MEMTWQGHDELNIAQSVIIFLSLCPKIVAVHGSYTPQIFTGKSRAAGMCFCRNELQRRLEL